jgi:hypothetical protein
VLVEDLIQPRIERMRGAPWQVVRRHPHRRLRRVPPSFAHRHRRQCSTRDRSCRSPKPRSSQGARRRATTPVIFVP